MQWERGLTYSEARGAIASPNWAADTIACDSCHGYPPSYASGSPKPNSHGKHNYTCDNCHYDTTTNGTAVTDPANHVNAAYDLRPGPGRSTGRCRRVRRADSPQNRWVRSRTG